MFYYFPVTFWFQNYPSLWNCLSICNGNYQRLKFWKQNFFSLTTSSFLLTMSLLLTLLISQHKQVVFLTMFIQVLNRHWLDFIPKLSDNNNLILLPGFTSFYCLSRRMVVPLLSAEKEFFLSRLRRNFHNENHDHRWAVSILNHKYKRSFVFG